MVTNAYCPLHSSKKDISLIHHSSILLGEPIPPTQKYLPQVEPKNHLKTFKGLHKPPAHFQPSRSELTSINNKLRENNAQTLQLQLQRLVNLGKRKNISLSSILPNWHEQIYFFQNNKLLGLQRVQSTRDAAQRSSYIGRLSTRLKLRKT